jgi:hypothetical protein
MHQISTVFSSSSLQRLGNPNVLLQGSTRKNVSPFFGAGSVSGEGKSAETGTSYGLTGWLPSMTMPAVSLPSLALPAWMPSLASSATSAPTTTVASTTEVSTASGSSKQPAMLGAEGSVQNTSAQGTSVPAAEALQPSAEAGVEATAAAASAADKMGAAAGSEPPADKQLPGSSTAAGLGAQEGSTSATGVSQISGSGTPHDVRPSPSKGSEEPEATSSAADRAVTRRAKLHVQVCPCPCRYILLLDSFMNKCALAPSQGSRSAGL